MMLQKIILSVVFVEVVFLLYVAVKALLLQDFQRTAIACVAAIFIPLVSERRWKKQKRNLTATPGLLDARQTRKLNHDARLKASFHSKDNHPSPSSQNRSSKHQPPTTTTPKPKIIIDDARMAEVVGQLVFEHHREQHASHHLQFGNKGTLHSTQVQENSPLSSRFVTYHSEPYNVKKEDIHAAANEQEYDVNFNYDHPLTPSSSTEIIDAGFDSE